MIKRWIKQKTQARHGARGQALVEYALILALLVISFGIVLAATGPAIGNVFENVVFNVIGQDPDLVTPIGTYGNPSSFWATVTWVATLAQPETPFVSLFTPPGIIEPTAVDPDDATATANYFESQTAAAIVAQAQTNVAGTSTGAAATANANASQTAAMIAAQSATPTESVFDLPFVEQGDTERRWRVGDVDLDTNPDNVDPTLACSWETLANDDSSASRDRFWDNRDGDSFPANTTCYLEVRGKIDMTGAANPILSFWERYDFSGATGVNISLEATNWVETGGVFDRAAAASSWINIWSAPATGANYNWSRRAFNLATVGGLGSEIALRFKIQSGGSPSTLVRWFLDDIQIVAETNLTREFNLNQTWDLNTRDQMDDFIFTADSARTLERPPRNVFGSSAWRWNLTGDNVAPGGGFSFDAFPGLTQYPIPPSGETQQYILQTRYPVDLVGAAVTDIDGNAGPLIVSFLHAYDVPFGSTLEVQYTTDVDISPDTGWTTLPTGFLLDSDGSDGKARSALAMSPVEVNINAVASTVPIHLRWVLTVTDTAAPGEGWYIDNIRLLRQAGSRYTPYPFTDDAEDSSFTADQWQGVGDWSAANDLTFGTFNGSGFAYGDSPSNTYTPGVTTSFETRRIIDLLDDTTTKPPGDDDGSRPVAADPYLSFWMKRELSANVHFTVDLWLRSTETWTTVWEFDSSSDSPATNLAWERIEIDLRQAVMFANGTTNWADILDNATVAQQYDDDIKIRFTLTPEASAVSGGGIAIDDIFIGEIPDNDWNLWSGGTGTAFEDNIQFTSAGLDSDVNNRWWLGAFGVQSLNAPGSCATLYDYRKTSGQALTDSVSSNLCPNASISDMTNYGEDDRRIVELRTIIDLSATPSNGTSSIPTLAFWTRSFTGTGDTLQVQIATENTSDSGLQSYDDMGGWNAWTTVWTRPATRRDTWQRELVDLSSYKAIGTGRIRVRFVVASNGDSSVADGWYVDGVRVDYSRAQTSLPLTRTQSAQTFGWLFEGNWGAASDVFWYESSVSASDALGGGLWTMEVRDAAVAPNLSTYDYFTESVAYTENTPDINKFMGTAGLPWATATSAFLDDFSIRWRRTNVSLAAGSYTFSIMGDDGYRLYINDRTNTDISAASLCISPGATSQYCIIERWTNQAVTTLYARTVTVSAAITGRTLTLDYFERTGSANIAMSVIQDQYSFTDSPNNLSTTTRTNSLAYGDSSILWRGYFDTSAGGFDLSYRRLYALSANTRFFVEQSTDGGFNWTPIASENLTGPAQLLSFEYNSVDAGATADTWQQRTVPLSADANLMIRFRLNTETSASQLDGVYIADVSISP